MHAVQKSNNRKNIYELTKLIKWQAMSIVKQIYFSEYVSRKRSSHRRHEKHVYNRNI